MCSKDPGPRFSDYKPPGYEGGSYWTTLLRKSRIATSKLHSPPAIFQEFTAGLSPELARSDRDFGLAASHSMGFTHRELEVALVDDRAKELAHRDLEGVLCLRKLRIVTAASYLSPAAAQ